MSLFNPRRRFSERNPVRIGVTGIVAVALLLGVVFNIGSLRAAFAGTTYTAVFVESGALKAGDPVRISGVKVGKVRSVEIDQNTVRVEFRIEQELGDQTRLAIKSETLLGAKFLDVAPRGTGPLDPSEDIPLKQTSAPYDLTGAIADLVRTSGKIDTAQLSDSLAVLSDTFAGTPESIRGVLDGTTDLARAVTARDGELTELLESAKGVSGVLAERNLDIVAIVSDGSALLASLQARRTEIGRLFRALDAISVELEAVARENRDDLAPTLKALRKSLKVIDKNRANLDEAIAGFSGFAQSLLEGLGSGPFFQAYFGGISPASMQPVVDGLVTDLLPSKEGK